MNKRVMAVIWLAAAISLTACGKVAVEETAQGTAAQDTTIEKTEAATEAVSARADGTDTLAIDGIVLDAAMNSVQIQSAEGIALEFAIEDAAHIVDLKDGLLIGIPVNITYSGTIKGSDTSEVTIEKISESAIVPSLSGEQLSFAADIILAVQAKELELLSSYVSYPVYVGIGEGETIKSKEEFMALDAAKVFTPELVGAVTSVNLFEIIEAEAGIVLGDGSPNIIFGGESGNFGIKGINY